MKYEKERIKIKFAQYAPQEYWGDDLDVRYLLISELKKLKNKLILDIGCGAGIILSELDKSNRRFGIDKNLKSLLIAQQLNPDSCFVRGDIDNLPVVKELFDIIILAGVIEYSSNKQNLLKQISRILKRDGILFLTTNNRRYSYYITHPNLLSFEQIVTSLDPYFTFQIKGYNPIPPLLFFLPKALKVRMNRRHQLMIPSGLLSYIPFIDTILRKLMNLPLLTEVCKGFYAEAKNNKYS